MYIRLLALIVCLVLLAACARRAAVQETAGVSTAESLESGGMKRTFVQHVPPSYTGDEAVPLVLVFHGGSGDGEGMERLTGWSAAADAHGFIVVYPDGADRRWRAGAGADTVDDVGFVRDLVAHLKGTYRIDARRVYAAGISNGAIFSNRLACELADQIAAIGAVAGTIDATVAVRCQPARPVSVIAFHGTTDPIVPYDGGTVNGLKASAEVWSADATFDLWTTLDGCTGAATATAEPTLADSPTTVRALGFPVCRDGSALERYVIVDGGHTWPGGKQYLPVAMVGETDRTVNATDLIWTFFSEHPMP